MESDYAALGTQTGCAGAYRQLQTRLRGNAESVAFYEGIKKEGDLVNSRFKKLTRHRAQLLRTQWLFGMWQASLCAGEGK